jgi:hypothetical protein
VEGINKYWPEMEKLFGDTFISANSCLYYNEDIESYKNFEKVAKTSNGQIEVLSIEQVRERFPNAPYIDTKMPVYHDTKAGVVFAEKYQKAITSFLRKYPNITIF